MRASAIWLLGVLAAALSSCAEERAPSPRPNVLFVSVDTLRADHLGSYGHTRPTSPHFDRIASRGLLFMQAATVVPTTLASHSTMFTGLFPYQIGVARNGYVLPDEVVTLAEILSDEGYATGGFVSSYVLSRAFGLAQGFARYDDELPERTTMLQHKTVRGSRATTDAALAWIRAAPQPFFAFVHYFDPHWPYAPPPEAPNFDPGYRGSVAGSQAEIRLLRERLLASGGEPDRDLHHLVALYDAEIAMVDAQLGRLWDALEGAGLAEDTVVVITADHGESFWEHDEFIDHGQGVYRTTLHIPLVIVPPGSKAGAVSNEPVSTLDLFPTLCELTGVEPPGAREGSSLVPLLTDPAATLPERLLFAEATKPPPVSGAPLRATADDVARWANLPWMKSLRKGDLAYVLTPATGREQLFDLAADPRETEDLLHRAERRGALTELREAMAARIAAIRSDARRAEVLTDAEVAERLRSLGYAE